MIYLITKKLLKHATAVNWRRGHPVPVASSLLLRSDFVLLLDFLSLFFCPQSSLGSNQTLAVSEEVTMREFLDYKAVP